MKAHIKYRNVILVLLSVFLLNNYCFKIYAQDQEKNRIRIKADYVKIMDGAISFNIKAGARIDRQNVDIPNIEILIVNEFNDDEVELGKVTTDSNGESKFILKGIDEIKADSTDTYTINFKFKGNDLYKRASKSISFRDATIKADLITKDSVNYITASLLDTRRDSLLSDQLLNVQIQRLFRPLRIGKDFNSTDENGTILVPIEDGIPGVDAILTLEVVLKDSDDYGTVKALVNAPVGTKIVDESTFDERTMWSPRNKTPIFLLIFPNLLIFSIWGLIIYLFINLFKISKT